MQEAVPEVHGEPTVAAAEYGEQVVFEGADFTLDRVALMDVGGPIWQSTLLSAMCDFSLSEALLSRHCSFGRIPQSTRYWFAHWYDTRCSGSVMLCMDPPG